MNQDEFERVAARLRVLIIAMAGRYVRETDAIQPDDVAQDTLLRLWIMREKLDNYSSVEALALTMARNMLIDSFRKTHNHEVSFMEPDQKELLTPHDLMAACEAERTMDAVLDSLPPAQRAILRMRHEEEMSISSIAEAIGSTEGAVRVALSRARRHVMELFKNKINE